MRDDLSWFELQLLAYREAARSVMACELGRRPPAPTIEIEDENVFREADLELPYFADSSALEARAAACRDCLYLLAGCAISLYVYRPHWTRESDAEASWWRRLVEEDNRQAREVVYAIGLTHGAALRSIDHLRNLAFSTLAQPRVLRRVRRVADALLKRGTLSAAEVRSIVAASDCERDGEPPPVRWATRRVVSPRSPVLRVVADAPLQPARRPQTRPKAGAFNFDLSIRRRRRRKRLASTASSRQPEDPGLASLNLSGRALGGLRRARITTREQLLKQSLADLLSARDVGPAIAGEIAAAVERAGFTLAKQCDEAISGDASE